MNSRLPLPQNKKLSVLFRVEPGCLGPDGADHIDGFCHFANAAVAKLDADFVHWDIVPRHDKSLAEMQYQIDGKNLSYHLAAKYLNSFGKELDEFEERLQERLALLINRYLGRQ